jgi:hypothetical protein
MKCFFDIESTALSVYEAEIIEAYFLLDNGDEYFFKSRVDNWSYEAEEIHKIKEATMLSYPSKKQAYRDLLTWISGYDIDEFVCFANPNTMHGFIHYDMGVIKVQLDELAGTHTAFYKYFNDNVTSVHTMARKAAQKRYFTPIKRKSETGRYVQSLTQENIYLALYGEKYENAHSAKVDVKAMVRIYYTLIQLENETLDIFSQH